MLCRIRLQGRGSLQSAQHSIQSKDAEVSATPKAKTFARAADLRLHSGNLSHGGECLPGCCRVGVVEIS
jgi:hypothetical protein